MEYMILIYSEPFDPPVPGSPEFDQIMAPWAEYNQRLIDGGHWVAGANLAPVGTATTVRRAYGAATTVTDGPFAETKEHLGGFYLISASDLDEALELARQIPMPAGSFEVRPVGFRPDAS